jgi:hypothetical protein
MTGTNIITDIIFYVHFYLFFKQITITYYVIEKTFLKTFIDW